MCISFCGAVSVSRDANPRLSRTVTGMDHQGWGLHARLGRESLVWDDQRGRLYFVDCAPWALHWMDGDGTGGELHTLLLPSMPAGVVPTTEGLLVVALLDGLYLVDPDDGTTGLLARYPDEMGGRANDARRPRREPGDREAQPRPRRGLGLVVFARRGWRLLDRDIANTNGLKAGVLDGQMTLVIGDTSAHYYAYPYEPVEGSVGPRRVFGDMTDLAGGPDGSTLDAHGGLWCAVRGRSARPVHGRGARPPAAPAGRQPHRRHVRRAGPRPPLRRVGRRWPRRRRRRPRRGAAGHRRAGGHRAPRAPVQPGLIRQSGAARYASVSRSRSASSRSSGERTLATW